MGAPTVSYNMMADSYELVRLTRVRVYTLRLISSWRGRTPSRSPIKS